MTLFQSLDVLKKYQWPDGTPAPVQYDLDHGQILIWCPNHGYRRIATVSKDNQITLDLKFAQDHQITPALAKALKKHLRSKVFENRKFVKSYSDRLEDLHAYLSDIEAGNTVSIFDPFTRKFFSSKNPTQRV